MVEVSGTEESRRPGEQMINKALGWLVVAVVGIVLLTVLAMTIFLLSDFIDVLRTGWQWMRDTFTTAGGLAISILVAIGVLYLLCWFVEEKKQ